MSAHANDGGLFDVTGPPEPITPNDRKMRRTFEGAALIALLQGGSPLIGRARRLVQPEHFDGIYRLICNAMLDLHDADAPVRPDTIEVKLGEWAADTDARHVLHEASRRSATDTPLWLQHEILLDFLRSLERDETALYYWYDTDHRLLYIGITNDLFTRQTMHAKRSAWTVFADHCKVEHYRFRSEAVAAEREAVRTLMPVFNREHNDTVGARQRLFDYLTEKHRIDLLKNYRYGPTSFAAVDAAASAVADNPTKRQRVASLNGRLVVSDGLPGRQSCTARNAKGARCKLVLENSQSTHWERVTVPGIGEVSAYDLDGSDDIDRWSAQRCTLHWPDGRAFTDPEWVDFDPEKHAHLLLPPHEPAKAA